MNILKGPVDRRIWLVTVVSIVEIVAVGTIVARILPSYTPSSILLRLTAAAIVTVFVALAKVRYGPRAAAVAGMVGTLIAVVLLIAFAWAVEASRVATARPRPQALDGFARHV